MQYIRGQLMQIREKSRWATVSGLLFPGRLWQSFSHVFFFSRILSVSRVVSPQRSKSESKSLTAVTFHPSRTPSSKSTATRACWLPAKQEVMACLWSVSSTGRVPWWSSRPPNGITSPTPCPGMPTASPVSDQLPCRCYPPWCQAGGGQIYHILKWPSQ